MMNAATLQPFEYRGSTRSLFDDAMVEEPSDRRRVLS